MYANNELCQKFNNNIPLDELNGPEFHLVTSDIDINSLCEMFPFLPQGIAVDSQENDYFYTDITGAVISLGDGDYEEVYVTESSRPYDLRAIYHPLEYYK